MVYSYLDMYSQIQLFFKGMFYEARFYGENKAKNELNSTIIDMTFLSKCQKFDFLISTNVVLRKIKEIIICLNE